MDARAYHPVVAHVHRQQQLYGLTAAHGLGHGRRNLAQQRIGYQQAQGPYDHVGVPGGHQHGVLAGGSGLGSGLEHGRGGYGIGAHGGYPAVDAGGDDAFYQHAAQSAALAVDNGYVHIITFSISLLDTGLSVKNQRECGLM